VDFSLFKPRGHYTRTEDLKRYFKSMMWCGTIDLRVAGPPEEVSTRELGSSVVLASLFDDPTLYESWERFDDALQKFIGITDSMNISQLRSALKEGKASISTIKAEDDLVNLQKLIISIDLGLC
jgi:hypothetical protein